MQACRSFPASLDSPRKVLLRHVGIGGFTFGSVRPMYRTGDSARTIYRTDDSVFNAGVMDSEDCFGQVKVIVCICIWFNFVHLHTYFD